MQARRGREVKTGWNKPTTTTTTKKRTRRRRWTLSHRLQTEGDDVIIIIINNNQHHTKEEDCQEQQKQQLELNVSHTSQYYYYTCNNQTTTTRKKERKKRIRIWMHFLITVEPYGFSGGDGGREPLHRSNNNNTKRTRFYFCLRHYRDKKERKKEIPIPKFSHDIYSNKRPLLHHVRHLLFDNSSEGRWWRNLIHRCALPEFKSGHTVQTILVLLLHAVSFFCWRTIHLSTSLSLSLLYLENECIIYMYM